MTSKTIMKALKNLNAYVDDDRQKLCDRCHDLELSHKRLEKLCREALVGIKTLKRYVENGSIHVESWFCNESFFCSLFSLRDRIERELSYPYFRANGRIKK